MICVFIQILYSLLNDVHGYGEERQVKCVLQLLPSRTHLHWGVVFFINLLHKQQIFI